MLPPGTAPFSSAGRLSRHVDEEECRGACSGQQEQHKRVAERLHLGLLEGRVERNRSRYRTCDGQVEQRVAKHSHAAERACASLVPAAIASLDGASRCSARDRRVAQGRLGFLQEWQEVAMKALARGVWVGGRIFMMCVIGAIAAGVFAAGLGTIAAALGIFLAS